MLKYILWAFVMVICSFHVTFAYVEWLVRCDVVGDRVSVVWWNKWFLCQHYLDQISVSLQKLDTAIDDVQSYIERGQDVVYWRGVLLWVMNKKDTVLAFEIQIRHALENFEYALYLKLKPYILGYMSKETNRCQWLWNVLEKGVVERACWKWQKEMIITIIRSNDLTRLIEWLRDYVAMRWSL